MVHKGEGQDVSSNTSSQPQAAAKCFFSIADALSAPAAGVAQSCDFQSQAPVLNAGEMLAALACSAGLQQEDTAPAKQCAPD